MLAENIIWKISSNVREVGMFTLMADKTADIVNIEQLVICRRWVDELLNAHE